MGPPPSGWGPEPVPGPGDDEPPDERAVLRERRLRVAALVGMLALVFLLPLRALFISPDDGDFERRFATPGARVATPSGPGASPSGATPAGREPVPSRPLAPALSSVGLADDELVAVTVEGHVLVLDQASGTVRRTLVQLGRLDGSSEDAQRLYGLALSPDRRAAYYALGTGDCGRVELYRMAVSGEGSAEKVADGGAPAPSPDGRRLAYAGAPAGHGGAGGAGACRSTLVVRDLGTGEERAWLPDGRPDVRTVVERISWAPDSRRLALGLSSPGPVVVVLDTERATGLTEAAALRAGTQALELSSPDWGTRVLGVVGSCCSGGTTAEEAPPRALALDPASGRVEPLLGPERAPSWIDFDAHDGVLFIDTRRALHRLAGGELVALGEGFLAVAG